MLILHVINISKLDKKEESQGKLPVVAFYVITGQHFFNAVKTKLSCFYFVGSFNDGNCTRVYAARDNGAVKSNKETNFTELILSSIEEADQKKKLLFWLEPITSNIKFLSIFYIPGADLEL